MKQSVRIAVGAVVGLILVSGLALVVELDIRDLQERSFDMGWAMVALLGYLPCAFVRAFRMRHFARDAYGDQGLLNMTAVVATHQAANHVLPMKLGELTYPTLMRVMDARSFVGGLGATLLMRFSDLVGLGTVVLFGAATFPDLDHAARAALVLGGILALSVGVVGIARGDFLLKVVGLVLRPIAPSWVEGFSRGLAEAVGSMEKSPSVWFAVVVESILLWFGLVGVHCALGCAFGLCLSLSSMAVGALGSILLGYLPVGTVFNLGTVEAGWVVTLPLVGVGVKEALLIGTSIHLSLVGITVLYAVAGLSFVWLRRGRASVESGEGSGEG